MAQTDDGFVSGVAGRYASALYELTSEQQSTEAVARDLRAFDGLIVESPDLQRLVRSPAFSSEQQLRALTVLLDRAGIGGLAANFIKLAATKRRLFAIRDMIRGFLALDDKARGVTRAEVTVAEPLADKHLDEIREALKQVTGGKSVELRTKVDPSLIGGLIVKLGSRMVDASLKTKLNTIRTMMKEVG